MVRLLVSHGVPLDQRDKYGHSVVDIAAGCSDLELLSVLLDCGAQVNLQDPKGKTPLDLARDDDVRQLLREHGGKTGKERNAESA